MRNHSANGQQGKLAASIDIGCSNAAHRLRNRDRTVVMINMARRGLWRVFVLTSIAFFFGVTVEIDNLDSMTGVSGVSERRNADAAEQQH